MHHLYRIKCIIRNICSIYINIYNDGEFERIPAYIGESLLEALRRFKVSNIPGYI